MNKHFTMNEPYTINHFEDDEYYYVFKFGVPILHFKNEQDAIRVVTHCNGEHQDSLRLREKIRNLEARDENRKEYQRILEAKISRLKERIRVLEKRNYPKNGD